MQRGFGSDNHSGVHPLLMDAILEANIAHTPSYGTDPWSEKAQTLFKEHFGPQSQTFFVFNGTAANVLALKAITPSYQAIFCADNSHLNVDECGAPEFFTGAKLITLPTQNGKMSVEALEEYYIRRGDQHFSQAQVLSLTQPTELGTVYSLQELKELITWAKSKKMFVHIDGARLSNAVVSLNTTFKAMTTDLGVDVVSFGGTKNGLMMGEAVIFLNKDLAKDFKYLRKQAAQLPSKTRFIACQFVKYLEGDLWKSIASHSVSLAQKLHQAVSNISQVEVTVPSQSNAVFAKIPQAWVKPLREKYFFYVWNEKTFECRWMTSWDTQAEDIEGFIDALKELSK